MRGYGEYCPVAIGAEAVGDRWTPLVLRELAVARSSRFNDIHRGVPRMSRSLLVQRLRQLERLGIVERRSGPTYYLTEAGEELGSLICGLGTWAKHWLLGDPEDDQLDGTHLMWRMHQRIATDELPSQRTVVEFRFPAAKRGRYIWLVLDRTGSSVCERDEGFDVNLVVTADIRELLKVWNGTSTWRDAILAGKLVIEGRRDLARAFPRWFELSPFASQI